MNRKKVGLSPSATTLPAQNLPEIPPSKKRATKQSLAPSRTEKVVTPKLSAAAELDLALQDLAMLRGELRSQFFLNRAYRRALMIPPAPMGLRQQLGDVLAALVRSGKSGPKAVLQDVRNLRALRRSSLFDTVFYRKKIGTADIGDPIRHYYYVGSKEGHDPSPIFSPSRYLQRYTDVQMAGMEPLSHFLRAGIKEGRDPLFEAIDAGSELQSELDMVRSGKEAKPRGRPTFDWLISRLPATDERDLKNYEHRPDDVVPLEAARGEVFCIKHRLLSKRPDFAAAVHEIEAQLTIKVDSKKPVVSILIPVYGQLGYTLNTLHSLALHKSKYSFEILVGDDCSPDHTEEFLKGMAGISYIRHARNGGFILNCNATAKEARGKYLVLLNNDTRVVDGWLDELIDSFDLFPNAGFVGSKLFYPDGSLQEAGGILWNDGSAWNYGRNQDPNWPEFCYARQVDYVSGASIATPLALWKKLGGFDETYCPAYYEDADYAFKVREAGFETWFQPLSRIIHYEGKTSGTNLGSGVKAYQVANASKFFARWKHTLVAHRANGHEPDLEKDRYKSRRVLVLDATAPTPDQDAGSVTAVKVMQVFQRLGYQVDYIPVDNFLYQRRYIDDLQRIGVGCIYAPFVSTLKDHLLHYGYHYDVIHVFRHQVMENVYEDIRSYAPKAKTMFNNMDLHFLRMQRQGEIEGDPKLIRAAIASKPHELRTMSRANIVFVPSSVEQDILIAEGDLPPVEVMPYMVDPQPPGPRNEKANNIIFLGGFDHKPNVDAVEWFVREVWPSLQANSSIGKFMVVGAKPPASIQALANDRIIVTGRVEDLGPIFTDCRAMVVPLRYGAGVKGKIYSALALGTPVITTGIGAEGIVGLEPGQDVLMAETPDDFVQAVTRVFDEPELYAKLCAQGPRFIDEFATLKAGERAMREAVKTLALPLPSSPIDKLVKKPGTRRTKSATIAS